jgi:hypothetical protein
VAAPAGDRGGTLARRSRSREPGLGRVGPAGSAATGWHHYDGARETTPGAASGEDAIRPRRDAVRTPHRQEGFPLTAKKRPSPALKCFRTNVPPYAEHAKGAEGAGSELETCSERRGTVHDVVALVSSRMMRVSHPLLAIQYRLCNHEFALHNQEANGGNL